MLRQWEQLHHSILAPSVRLLDVGGGLADDGQPVHWHCREVQYLIHDAVR
jgi:hypothetical protein